MSIRYRAVVENVASQALSGNPLGDPSTRELHLLVPEDHDPAEPIPLLFVLSGYSGVGKAALVDDPWAEGLQRRVERLSAEGRVGPMVYALPDTFTRYGGSQYLDSAATGRYEAYLWDDLVSAVKARYAISRVGAVGKSSGGYGALVGAMRRPDVVSAVACHAGDMAFEYCYLPHFPTCVRTAWRYGGLSGFLEHFAATHKKRSGQVFDAINTIAMASCYSPDQSAPLGFALPFDLYSGEIRREVWARWLAWDPVRMIDDQRHADALKKLRLLFVDAGTHDEYALDLGARIFSSKLHRLEVPHVHQEFEDGHMGITYRYDVSLPLLWDALK